MEIFALSLTAWVTDQAAIIAAARSAHWLRPVDDRGILRVDREIVSFQGPIGVHDPDMALVLGRTESSVGEVAESPRR